MLGLRRLRGDEADSLRRQLAVGFDGIDGDAVTNFYVRELGRYRASGKLRPCGNKDGNDGLVSLLYGDRVRSDLCDCTQNMRAVVGQIVLALLISAISGVLPATMAELAPWRVRCTVLSIAYNLGMALLGGTTPLVAAWLVARTGSAVAPGVYLTAAGALAFVAAILLPKTLPHRLTAEFHSVRSADAHTPPV